MARNCTKERWGEGGFYMEQPDHEDESLSLSDLPINLIKDGKPHFLFEKKPKAVETPIAADDEEFDFGFKGGFSNSKGRPPPQMCLADEVFFQGQLLPVRLSVSSDNSSAGFYNRHGSGSIGKFRSINSSGSSSSISHSSSSSVTNNSITSTSAARNSRPRVPNLFHSHPSPKPHIKASPTTFRQASTGGGRSQKSSSTWDFFRLGVVKAPGMELQDLKHRSSTRRNSSVSRSNSGRALIPGAAATSKGRMSIERKSGGILSGGGCKCSVEWTVAPAVVVRRKKELNENNIPAQAMAKREKAMRELRMKKVEKEKEQQEKLALSRHRTFEWVKELSHATFPCEAEADA